MSEHSYDPENRGLKFHRELRLVRASAEASPDGWIRLNANECAFLPSPLVVESIAGASNSVNRYPDPLGEPLRSQLAEYHQVAVDQILLSHGADGILAACFRAFCNPGCLVAMLDPTYPFLYNLAEISSAQVLLSRTPEELLDCAHSSGAHLTVLVNPNNPTGTWLEPEQLVDRVPGAGVLILDEAYASFAPRSAITLLGDRSDLLVVRSFSKSYGLAGVRLGYAVGSQSLIGRLSAAQDPYPVSSLSVAAGLAVLRDEKYYAGCIGTVRAERERLTLGLRELGWEVDQSYANFVFGTPPAGTLSDCVDLLGRERVHVRTFAHAAHGLRISVGLPEENSAVLRALRR
ncbi:pyridoxal phosphate-dependent aminotransferase [Amycolatopsis sp. NBC_00438]|uniref:pyridoxal phosphate-dependent aminotransferase n=1 Tax=Amycolatopsis sp. NBC_00438 TaxID=2903558 RepID=UPI002E200A4C